MNQEILDYIKSQRVGILAVEMLDGSPHAATVHIAHTENPLIFFCETYRDARKIEPLLKKESARASLVVGFDESNMKTLQMDGVVKLVYGDERRNRLIPNWSCLASSQPGGDLPTGPNPKEKLF